MMSLVRKIIFTTDNNLIITEIKDISSTRDIINVLFSFFNFVFRTLS